MLLIGITGGVGCGKSEVLRYIGSRYHCRILLTDDLARSMEAPGGPLYEKLTGLLENVPGENSILLNDGSFNNREFALRLFRSEELRNAVNDLVHPAVRAEVLKQAEEERLRGEYELFFVESALLLDAGFGRSFDSLWYIYCPESTRRERLKKSRGYSDEKTDSILKTQYSEDFFRSSCDVVINNGGSLEQMQIGVDEAVRKLMCSNK